VQTEKNVCDLSFKNGATEHPTWCIGIAMECSILLIYVKKITISTAFFFYFSRLKC